MPERSTEAARRCRPAPGLIVKWWDGSAGVVYDPALAKTHLVSAEALAVLTGSIGVDDEGSAELIEALLHAGLLVVHR